MPKCTLRLEILIGVQHEIYLNINNFQLNSLNRILYYSIYIYTLVIVER